MKLLRFSITTLFLTVVLGSYVSAQSLTNRQEQGPTIRVTVDRVNVGVIITDKRGKFVEGLLREDFRVFDNGAEQPVTDFIPLAEPAQVLLLIESGPAVVFLERGHFHAADNLLSGLLPGDRVAVAGYSKEPELLLGFTTDKQATRLALQNLNFALGFGDLNLSSSLASAIDWLATQHGKKTVVVLSTGVDTSPAEKWQRIQQKLVISDVRILAVSLSGEFRRPIKHKVLSPQERKDQAAVKQGFAAADQSLRELTAVTGGRVYFPKNQKDFERAYAEIAQLIRHEYSLAFVPPARDGQVHSIEVKVRGFEGGVDHRQAYLAAPLASAQK